ncbi:MAG: hypothetical protein ACTHJS_11835 [Xanthobacteraceae bacterium]|jgi:hypothetical protein
MPADVPPRPGTPGYAEFVAHGQAVPEAKQPPAATAQGAVQPAAATEAPAASAPAPASAAPAAPIRAAAPDGDMTQDSSVVKGGLY